MVLFPHPKQKGIRQYGNQDSKCQYDLPQREAGLKGAELGVEIPQPHRPAGPQRGGQVHPDEVPVRHLQQGQRADPAEWEGSQLQNLERGAGTRRRHGASGVEPGTQAQCYGQYLARPLSHGGALHVRKKDAR